MPTPAAAATGLFGTGPSTSQIPATTTDHRAAATTNHQAATTNHKVAHPVTGPIPVQRAAEAVEPEDEEPLTARESACCTFFTFTITADPTEVTVDVEVPPVHVDVLDALQDRGAMALASR